MLKPIFLLALCMATFSTTAQTINLEFPYFAGNTYQFKIVQGNKQIVLQNDTIPQGGKVQLSIPEQYKGYKGMAMWYLTNSTTGGGLELVINNEDFSVSLLDSIPTATNISYTNSPENTFQLNGLKEELALFEKHDAMLAATRAYDTNTKQYRMFTKEYQRIIQTYDAYVKKLESTNLYAARFRQIANITKGIGSIITQDEALKATNINTIIVHELDFEEVYTSNFWWGIINSFVQFQTNVLKDDAQFIADAKTILNRITSDKIYTEFVEQLTKNLTKAGKDNIITGISPTIKNDTKLENYKGVLNVYKVDLNDKAPDLVIVASTGNAAGTGKETKTINLAQLESTYSVLVFYQSGCGPCQDLMAGLLENYKTLTDKGIEIISIASDTNEQEFKTTAAQHPWSQKYCDLQGFNGVNFKNYAVLGTPTLFALDGNGNILKKMSSMLALLAWSKSLKE